jgi:hypothetical protein
MEIVATVDPARATGRIDVILGLAAPGVHTKDRF